MLTNSQLTEDKLTLCCFLLTSLAFCVADTINTAVFHLHKNIMKTQILLIAAVASTAGAFSVSVSKVCS